MLKNRMSEEIINYLQLPQDRTFIENLLKKRSFPGSVLYNSREFFMSPYFILQAPDCFSIGRYVYYSGLTKFIVCEGSVARLKSMPSLVESGKGYYQTKMSLIKDGTLKKCNENQLILMKDFFFDSSSAAAAIMSGTKRSGKKDWRECSSNKTLAEWEKSKTYSFYCKIQNYR